jgi:hypothetical protein
MTASKGYLSVLLSAGSKPIKFLSKEAYAEETSQRPLRLGKSSSSPRKECPGSSLHIKSIRMKIVKDEVSETNTYMMSGLGDLSVLNSQANDAAAIRYSQLQHGAISSRPE